MFNKKFIAKEWLLLLFSLLFGHFFLVIFILIIDLSIIHSGESLKSIYSTLPKNPEMLLVADLYFYIFIQVIRGTIWSIKQLLKK